MKNIKIKLILILFLALAIRLFFFFLTKNQSLWWDEAEYMLIAKNFVGVEQTYTTLIRPIMLSLIISFFMGVGLNAEIFARLLMMFFSLTAIGGIYLCGKQIFNHKVGLLSAFFMSVFSFMLFLTTKITVDLPAFSFFVFGAFFFYKYLQEKEKKPKYIYLTSFVIGIGSLFRITTLIFLFIAILQLFFMEGFRFFKRKEIWISVIILSLIFMPYIIWGYIQYHTFILTAATDQVKPNNYFINGISNMITAFLLFFQYLFIIKLNYTFGMILFLIFLIISFFAKKNQRNFYLILIIFIPFIFSSFMINHVEDRYFVNSLLGIILLLSTVIISLFDLIAKHCCIEENYEVAVIFLAIILVSFGLLQVNSANLRIKDDLNSFDNLREGGYWLKENSLPNQSFISTNPMQISYYSERYGYQIPKEKRFFNQCCIEENYEIRYVIISESESSYTPVWLFEEAKKWKEVQNIKGVRIYLL